LKSEVEPGDETRVMCWLINKFEKKS
jgi:hypothetical protein